MQLHTNTQSCFGELMLKTPNQNEEEKYSNNNNNELKKRRTEKGNEMMKYQVEGLLKYDIYTCVALFSQFVHSIMIIIDH